jgi:hypothetical protein
VVVGTEAFAFASDLEEGTVPAGEIAVVVAGEGISVPEEDTVVAAVGDTVVGVGIAVEGIAGVGIAVEC